MKLQLRVREALAAAICDGPRLVLAEKLDRTVYSHVARALENAGGTWSRQAQAFLFDRPAAEAIEPLLLTGEVNDARADHAAFYTPPELADEVIAQAAIAPGMEVLEPSAGGGALAVEARRQGAKVTCVEIRPEACHALRSLRLQVEQADFLALRSAHLGLFDRVVMNPPFNRRQDVAHVAHALRFLRPGGRLVALVAAGFESRSDRATVELRDQVIAQRGSWTRLPSGSFRSAGTDVQVCLVVVDLQRFTLPTSPELQPDVVS